jgi:hypothetical protein
VAHRLVLVFAVAAFLALPAACAPLKPGAVRAFGFVWLVSRADIRAAIAADQRAWHQSSKEIDHVEVVGGDEIRVFHVAGYEGYDEVRRVRGTWCFMGEIGVTA